MARSPVGDTMHDARSCCLRLPCRGVGGVFGGGGCFQRQRFQGENRSGVRLKLASFEPRDCRLIDAEPVGQVGLREAKGLASGGNVHVDAYMRIGMAASNILCVGALERKPRFSYRRDVPDDLSKRIAAARRALGMTQAQFAEALDVNQATVSRWESGSTPEIVQLGRISQLTGVDLASLANSDFEAARTGPALFIKGEVAAGVWKEAWEWDQSDWQPFQGGSHIEAPLEARFGLVVIGESMNEVYPPGTQLDCVSCIHAGITEFRSGQRVIVIRRRFTGEVEATVKEYLENGDGVWLVPKSRNPAFQQPISMSHGADDIEETAIIAVVKGSYRPE